MIEPNDLDMFNITDFTILLSERIKDARTNEVFRPLVNITNVTGTVMTANKKMKSLDF